MHECEFCDELHSNGSSRFARLYGDVCNTRVMARSEHFVAIPTLGQIFEGSLLILPLAHVETSSSLPEAQRRELASFLDEVIRSTGITSPLFFEHGATAENAGGCGIHHAHIHLVPLPQSVPVAELFPEGDASFPNFGAALDGLVATDHYLMIGNGSGAITRDLSVNSEGFESQFFRRRLVEFFSLERAWNWREYDFVEPAVLSAIGQHA